MVIKFISRNKHIDDAYVETARADRMIFGLALLTHM
jgi:hypothetical protein